MVTEEQTALKKHLGRLQLYVRMGWGVLLLFGMLGNCAKPGNPVPVYIIIFVAIMWSCVRALTEAIDAYRVLMMARAHDAKKDEKGGDRGDPPDPASPA